MSSIYKIFNTLKSTNASGSAISTKTPASNTAQKSTSSSTHKPHLLDKYHYPQCNRPNYGPIKVTINIETPPVVMYGPGGESSGSYFSGNVVVDVKEDTCIKDVKVSLIQITQYAAPFISQTLQSCKECKRRINEICSWDLLPESKTFYKGRSYSYPLSHILPGSLPPSSSLIEGSYIKYELVCIVNFDNGAEKDMINLAMPIMIIRSILRGHDRNSLRIFPPTEVTASAVIPNVVYPRSVFPVEIRMDNVVGADRRWRMRKLNWRFEESVIVKLNNCEQHDDKFAQSQREMKKLQRNRKIHKSSGGLGHKTLNFYFQIPDKVLKARALAEAARIAAENERDRLQQGQDPIVEEPLLDAVPTNEMGPLGSSWSYGGGVEERLHNSPSNTNNVQTLENPDEVVVSKKKNEPELYVEEIKTLAMGELKSGWKSDFSGNGRIEMNVEIPISDLVSPGFNNATSYLSSMTSHNCNSPLFDASVYELNSNECNCSIDMDDAQLGIFVSHNLILEAVVGEEVISSGVPAKKAVVPTERAKHNSDTTINANNPGASTRIGLSADDFQDVQVGPQPVTGNKSSRMNNVQGVPTGIARVLRMQFRACLTERSGMGVSWDAEVPPTYDTISDEPMPPSYHS